jgi:hypothetical protein
MDRGRPACPLRAPGRGSLDHEGASHDRLSKTMVRLRFAAVGRHDALSED